MANDQYPLVTVITPTYNRADYLNETIRSILDQDYPNLEYIVLDDGSTDHTNEVLSAYSKYITWKSHPNMGEQKTVNRGFKIARGQYIGVVNSDDLLLPGAILAAVKTFIENPDVLVTYPGWSYINEKSNILYEEFVPEFNYELMVRKHLCIVGPGAFIHRRAFKLTGFRDESLRYVADFDYWLRLGMFGPFKRIPGMYGTFRIHSSSASVQMKNNLMAAEHISLMKKYFSLPGVPSHLKTGGNYHEAWSRAYLHAARTCPIYSQEAVKYFLLSALTYPPIFPTIIGDLLSNPKSWLKRLASNFNSLRK
jgi:glycosyltransferase involved in cell wall biosynthesis